MTAITLIAFLLPPEKRSASPFADVGSNGIDGPVAAPAATARPGDARSSVETAPIARGPAITVEEAKRRGLRVDFGPTCDLGTERIKVPSRDAPPCVVPPRGPNPGATSKGVTAKEIVVVVYRAQPDPASDTIVRAAGANDSDAEVEATFKDWKAYFESHYQTWGRKVKLVFIRASGTPTDDVAARADAKKVDLEHHAFAVWAHLGAPAAFVDELSARKIIWITGETRPTSFYLKRAPYGWGVQMNLDQGFVHAAEYIGERLWGKTARWAGPGVLQTRKRKFGLIYGDQPDRANRPATDFFQRELAKYGATLADRADISQEAGPAQEQARPIIQRFKANNITSVMFTGSPLTPIFLTNEATQQQYFPEWVQIGGNLVDTTFFGRTYDPAQWSHAFGISQLTVRPPEQQTENWYQTVWQTCHAPTARAEYGIIYQPEFIFYTAVHLAGPVLNPLTFRDALFSFPAPPVGISSFHRSFGRHGLWPTVDYGAFDDATEVWWDGNAFGNDEISKPGKGMYRYVNNGKRYAPSGWPSTEPAAFNTANAPTQLSALPAQDRYPKYTELRCK